MRISCLHTRAANIPLYEAACPDGVHLVHHLRSDLCHRALKGLDSALVAETRALLRKLRAGSDAVLFTSVLLREAVEPPALLADRLLAEVADIQGQGLSVEVLHACPNVTEGLVTDFGRLEGPASIAVNRVDDAWSCAVEGDKRGYRKAVRAAVEASAADLVVLPEPAMAAAVPSSPRILAVPGAALDQLAGLAAAA